MGQTNSNGSIIDRIARLERELDELKKSAGISSAIIRRGGLTLLDDAFLRMVDDLGVEIMYFGPDSSGRQMVRLRREGGADILYTYFTRNGEQYWALTDRGNSIIFSDDGVSGQGIARPSLSVPTRTMRWDNLPSAPDTSWQNVVDTGWFLKQQPYCSVQIVHCSTASDTSGEVRLLLDDVQVGSTIAAGWAFTFNDIPRFALPGSHMSQHKLVLQVRRTAGTGRVGADMVIRQEQS